MLDLGRVGSKDLTMSVCTKIAFALLPAWSIAALSSPLSFIYGQKRASLKKRGWSMMCIWGQAAARGVMPWSDPSNEACIKLKIRQRQMAQKGKFCTMKNTPCSYRTQEDLLSMVPKWCCRLRQMYLQLVLCVLINHQTGKSMQWRRRKFWQKSIGTRSLIDVLQLSLHLKWTTI